MFDERVQTYKRAFFLAKPLNTFLDFGKWWLAFDSKIYVLPHR